MATKIIGLDLGTHTVKVCELVSAFRNQELVGFDFESVEVDPDQKPTFQQQAQAARRLLERRGLLGETVICALPPGLASTTTLSLPFDLPKKIEAVLPFQLDEAIPVDIEDVIYDYQVVGRDGKGNTQLLVAYVKWTELKQVLDALEEEGVDPKQVTLGPLSVAQLHEHLIRGSDNRRVALIDLGHTHTELTVLDRGAVRIVRDIPGGGRDITQALAASFQVDATDAERGKLSEGCIGGSAGEIDPNSRDSIIDRACQKSLNPVIREIRRSLASFEIKGDALVEEVYLTGGTSKLRGLIPYLKRELGLEVSLIDPLEVPFNRLTVVDDRPRAFMAKSLGLAVQGSGRRSGHINFRKDEFAYTGDFGFLRGRVIATALAMSMMVLLGAMMAISQKGVLEAEHEQLRLETVSLSKEILGAESDDIDLLLSTVVGTGDSRGNAIPDASAYRLLAAISREIEEDLTVDVDRIELDVARKNLKIRGKTGSGGDVERIVDALRKTRCFKQIKKGRVEKSVDDRTRFRLSATVTCT